MTTQTSKPQSARNAAPQIALFNASRQIWESARTAYLAYPMGGPRLTVYNGHVSNGYEVLARFKNQRSAVSVLTRAGFCRQSDGTFKAGPLCTHELPIDELGAAFDRAAGTVQS